MKFLKVAVLFFGLAAAFAVRAQGGTYPVSGRVIDRLSRRPVAYAAVVLAGQEQKGASTDSLIFDSGEMAVPAIVYALVMNVVLLSYLKLLPKCTDETASDGA